MANGLWSLPLISTPFWAKRYVPCSVATEHFAPAAFSSLANPLPTASTPTRPTTPNTTNRAARYLFMRSVPPCFVRDPSNECSLLLCEGSVCAPWHKTLQSTKKAPNFGELRQHEVRRIPILRGWVNKSLRG